MLLPGLDVLRAQSGHAARDLLSLLRGQRVGLLTNHTGRAIDGTPALDVLRELGLDVAALFSPEHGFAGTREGHIESSQVGALPVHSLYGETRRPTPQMVSAIDVLVCDLQDVGARFYTYASTVALCLEGCLPCGVMVVILDRPNPLGGTIVSGPLVEETQRSFIGHLRVPIQHSLTMGELSRLHVADENLNADLLHVLNCVGWRRQMSWRETGLPWIAPSPNLPDINAARWYPGLCLSEFSEVAVGRGTDAPFQMVGAPWMNTERVQLQLARVMPPDSMILALPVEFTPTRAIYEGERCCGLRFVAMRAPTQPLAIVDFGICLLAALQRAHPDEFALDKALSLLGSKVLLELLRDGEMDAALAKCREDERAFIKRRREITLYR